MYLCLPFLETLKATEWRHCKALTASLLKECIWVQKGSVFCIFYDSLCFYSHIKKIPKILLFLLGPQVCLFHIQIHLVRPHNIIRLKPANCRTCSFPPVCKCHPSVLLLFFALCSIKGWELLGRKITVPEIVRKSF